MDKRTDQKKSQSGDSPFFCFFARKAENGVLAKFSRSSSDISSSRPWIYSQISGKEVVGNNCTLLSLQPWIFKKVRCSTKEEDDSEALSRLSFDWGGFSRTPNCSPRRFGHGGDWIRSKKRREDSYIIRPVTYSENMFSPSFLSKKAEIKECIIGLHSSLKVKETGSLRAKSMAEQPDNRQGRDVGHGILAGKKMTSDQIGDTVYRGSMAAIDVPHLPLRKLRNDKRDGQEAALRSIDSCSKQMCNAYNTLGPLFFLLGIAVGVASPIFSNKIEVGNPNKLLKDDKDLVQDCHKEPEKENLIITKNLVVKVDQNEDIEAKNIEKFISVSQKQIAKSNGITLIMGNNDVARMTNAGVNLEALSEIEAELEAELERLEQNIDASGIGNLESSLIELHDTELTSDIVQGELRQDLLAYEGTQYISDADAEDKHLIATTHPHNVNCAVSPKELSLRLHEVIEIRLEEKIKELEIALEKSHSKLKLVESMRPSFDTPLLKQGDPILTFEDEKLLSKVIAADEVISKGGDIAKGENWEQMVSRTLSCGFSSSNDDDDDDDDADCYDERMNLIQKIVEKTKQGSPARLKAQRMFLMMDL